MAGSLEINRKQFHFAGPHSDQMDVFNHTK